MNLSKTGGLAAAYKSGSQRTRVVTEFWGEHNLYCPNCSSPELDRLSHNTKASDFCCPKCKFWYQLKGQQSRIGSSVTDGAYEAMMTAIRNDESPSYYFMHYDLATWRIKNLLLIPHFAFPPSAIIKRKPLSQTARRAGWIGCNFALNRIPLEARIAVVTECQALPEQEVRERFRRVKPLKELSITERGWTLDVLNAVRRLVSEGRALRVPNIPGKSRTRVTRPSDEFTTADVYAFERELEAMHPDNRHVRDKIRQQLQVLRDAKLLIHVERGVWRLP